MKPIVDQIYHTESRQILSTLIRLLGDFDLAEEAMHEAFAIALQKWKLDGVPDNPRAWLISTARFKAIDQIRRQARFDYSLDTINDVIAAEDPSLDEQQIEDDPLRLIFTCCHPALAEDARLALTLREVCGMTTEEVAHAFLKKPTTIAQRIVRAKNKIREAGIPYEVPETDQLTERLQSVLQVIYLIFNEGYSASNGEQLVKHELATEAIRLGKLLKKLLPEPEVTGLLALMLLQDSRRYARVDTNGELITLEEQDRNLWDQQQIQQGCELVIQALASQRFGLFTLQAAIAAVHAEAKSFEQTDWQQIVGLYDALLQFNNSPVIRLNRAVAIAMHQGPAAGLTIIEDLLTQGELNHYHLIYAAKADLCRRINQFDTARLAYQQALALTQQAPEQRFLQRRLDQLD
ncbi:MULTISPECIES: RNA polymerase sigma factor [unclassified Methylophaga]|jgi:RNA polymerase sigma-70 factor (ECF subfamily)|uniref:RNA polymerase sigma factor n=2 Tax=Methylophaga TaxID=40222 RepID=UPI000C90B0DD|nr:MULTISPECIES: RNA polymerase sigma factor [unclassified Methylophaga]MAK67109.1 RNA polymerase subunit sigma-24 [Methylophaga sp.]MAY18147.1 RNA polymerase subunit sigma-24 [Methylophaga sp.]MBN45570.1 RNA polymerase subunit sigma-24 [Methylophaga sp.]HAO24397.1 RNA polymerase subunit sigma-24 [Methylophaga sp.]HCD06361.1 RNA polymerase subunit sigma-24 [Methylophaga sp.]|tara:strand:- start:51145 stop:52362 length:1218 start_codon:yes stop_codon:yes gene_type:complete